MYDLPQLIHNYFNLHKCDWLQIATEHPQNGSGKLGLNDFLHNFEFTKQENSSPNVGFMHRRNPGEGGTHIFGQTGMCRSNGCFFNKKSLNMGPAFYKKSLNMGQLF